MTASAISAAAEEAIHEAKPWVERLARLGFVAKGILYITIGALALSAALRLGGARYAPQGTLGQRGAMGALLAAPAGRLLLVIIAIGLFGYAAWRFIEAVRTKGLAKRIGSAVLGAIQLTLGISALKIAFGHVEAANDGTTTTHWTGRALVTPGGIFVLWVIAAGFIVYGGYEIYRGWRAKLDKELRLGSLSRDARRIVIGASRFGIAARGVVLATTGILVARAIQQRDPEKVKGIKASLIELLELGRGPFVIIAAGLVAYGIYQLINARYRRIRVA